MRKDYTVDQSLWTDGAMDPLLKQGICMAICYDWAHKCVHSVASPGGDLFDDDGPAWQRKLSFQRAYDQTWYDQGRKEPYEKFYRIISQATDSFLRQNAQHDDMSIEPKLSTSSRLAARQCIESLAGGEACLLLIAGDNNPGEAKGAWAHVVAISGNGGSRPPLFFDPNQGQYRFGSESRGIGQDVLSNLLHVYEEQFELRIRDYRFYAVK